MGPWSGDWDNTWAEARRHRSCVADRDDCDVDAGERVRGEVRCGREMLLKPAGATLNSSADVTGVLADVDGETGSAVADDIGRDEMRLAEDRRGDERGAEATWAVSGVGCMRKVRSNSKGACRLRAALAPGE